MPEPDSHEASALQLDIRVSIYISVHFIFVDKLTVRNPKISTSSI